MKVELIKPWNGLPEGYIFTEMGKGQAQLLVQRGLAKILPEGPATKAEGNHVVKAVRAAKNKALQPGSDK